MPQKYRRGGSVTFDIASLLDYNPPAFRCPRCLGIMEQYESVFSLTEDDSDCCPTCSAKYRHYRGSTSEGVRDTQEWKAYLGDQSLLIRFDDPLEHGRQLGIQSAALLDSFSSNSSSPPLRLLLDLLSKAQSFVHVITWSLDSVMVGVLKMLAVRVPIAVIATSVHETTRSQLQEFPDEHPLLTSYCPRRSDDGWHQKLVVVDGLVAVTGSANFTTRAYRKADLSREHVEVVTDLAQVRELNNQLFSRQWHELGGSVDRVDLPDPASCLENAAGKMDPRYLAVESRRSVPC